MARKIKTQQRQKQKQTVSQQVIVQLADTKKTPRKRRARKAPKSGGVASEYLQGRVAPIVAYQYTNVGPPPPSATPVKVPRETTRPALEDLGSVGQAEILDLPTKSETLQELESPVPAQFDKPFKPTLLRRYDSPRPGLPQVDLGSSASLFGTGPEDVFEEPNPMLNESLGLRSRKPRKNTRAELTERYLALADGPVPDKIKVADLKVLVERLEAKARIG